MVRVELVYIAEDQTNTQLELMLPEETTVAQALEISAIYQIYPETKNYPVGIFGKKVSLDRLLRAGDRIEIYRPLTLHPMEKRRQRAKKSRNA